MHGESTRAQLVGLAAQLDARRPRGALEPCAPVGSAVHMLRGQRWQTEPPTADGGQSHARGIGEPGSAVHGFAKCRVYRQFPCWPARLTHPAARGDRVGPREPARASQARGDGESDEGWAWCSDCAPTCSTHPALSPLSSPHRLHSAPSPPVILSCCLGHRAPLASAAARAEAPAISEAPWNRP